MANGDSPLEAVGEPLVQVTSIMINNVWRSTTCLNVARLTLTFFAVSLTSASYAQSVDSCMEARASDAINVCQSILDKGSRNANVYWKLASSLHQFGNTDKANTVLQKARSLHPGDKNLRTLAKLIESDADEQAKLAASASKNERMLSQGALKIACLSKSGQEGIKACNDYLQLTNDDAGRMQNRLAELRSASVPTPAPVPQPTPQPEPAPQPSPLPAPDNNDAKEPVQVARSAHAEAILTVQQLLNDLGFNVGRPDGIAGNRTRKALDDIYVQLGQIGDINNINQNTVADLDQARTDLVRARGVLQQSRSAEQNGEIQLAIDKLDEANRISPLLASPPNYRSSLSEKLIALANVQAENNEPVSSDQDTDAVVAGNNDSIDNGSTTGVANSEPAIEPATNSAQQAIPDSQNDEQFDQLMSQIRLMRSKLQQSNQTIDAQLNDLRRTVMQN